jgi:hypothetical protein
MKLLRLKRLGVIFWKSCSRPINVVSASLQSICSILALVALITFVVPMPILGGVLEIAPTRSLLKASMTPAYYHKDFDSAHVQPVGPSANTSHIAESPRVHTRV